MTPFVFGVFVILLAITLIDIGKMEIPNGLTIALIPFAIGAIWLNPEITLLSRGIGAAAVSLPMLIFALAIRGAFGGGDIKLMAVCGFMLGWQSTIPAIFIALVTGGILALAMLKLKKAEKKSKIPFAPHLCLGIMAALLYGEEIVSWFMEVFN
jgi:leader peptidase (prepilin peptidase)/N-methyltransferase